MPVCSEQQRSAENSESKQERPWLQWVVEMVMRVTACVCQASRDSTWICACLYFQIQQTVVCLFFWELHFFSEGLEQECMNTYTNMFHISEAFMSLLLKLLEHKLKVYSLYHQRLIKEVWLPEKNVLIVFFMASVCRFYCEQYILVYFGNKNKKTTVWLMNILLFKRTTTLNTARGPPHPISCETSREFFVFVIIFL